MDRETSTLILRQLDMMRAHGLKVTQDMAVCTQYQKYRFSFFLWIRVQLQYYRNKARNPLALYLFSVFFTLRISDGYSPTSVCGERHHHLLPCRYNR